MSWGWLQVMLFITDPPNALEIGRRMMINQICGQKRWQNESWNIKVIKSKITDGSMKKVMDS